MALKNKNIGNNDNKITAQTNGRFVAVFLCLASEGGQKQLWMNALTIVFYNQHKLTL